MSVLTGLWGPAVRDAAGAEEMGCFSTSASTGSCESSTGGATVGAGEGGEVGDFTTSASPGSCESSEDDAGEMEERYEGAGSGVEEE